ncbi:MAG: hypothetical protein ABSC06_18550 [Rhodopila sp.]
MSSFLGLAQDLGSYPIAEAAIPQDVWILGSSPSSDMRSLTMRIRGLHWHSRDDLAILADSGTSIAHCPSPFARRRCG